MKYNDQRFIHPNQGNIRPSL